MRTGRVGREKFLWRDCLLAAAAGLVVVGRADGLTINLSYDSTVTSQSDASSIESATQYAAQQIENLFTDNITININVASNNSTFGGSGYSLGLPYSYTDVRGDLIASKSTTTDNTAYATLPVSPDPTGGGTFGIPGVEQKALGLVAGNGAGNDGTFTFGNNVPWTFDPNNRAVSGDYDFIGVAEHEMTEIMGRNGGLGQGGSSLYRPTDLFRYSGVGQRNLNVSANNSYFSFDGGVTDLMDYPSGTEMDWANGLTDAFDTASVQGTENDITPTDIAIMDVLGYHAGSNWIINHVGTGNWSVAAAWSPGNVPISGQGAYLTYGDGVSRTITYDYTGAAVTLYSLQIDLANATGSATTKLMMSANALTVSGFEIVGRNGSGTISQSGGTNTVNGINGLFLGYNGGSTGTYNLSGTGALTVSGTEFIGNSGTGTFSQTAGGNSAFAMIIANGSSSIGNYSLATGATLSTSDHEIIGGSGNGTFTQTGGGNSYSGYMTVADQPGSVGLYTMSGGTLQGGYMGAGQQGQGTITQSAGTVTVNDHLSIGDHPGSTGNYNLSGTGQLNAGYEYVGYEGNGTLTQNGGTNSPGGFLTIADQQGGVGLYTMQSGSMQTGYVGCGQNGQGGITQSGGTITITDHLSIGDQSTGVGTYTLSGTGQLTTNFEYIAYLGTGTFTQTGGTDTNNSSLNMGVFGGSVAIYNLSGGTSTVTGSAYVGGSGGGAGGSGTLTVSSTGQLTVDGTLFVDAAGRVNINGGTATVGGLWIDTGGGVVNVNKTLNIHYGAGNSSPLATILGYIRSGYHGGAWTGSGIITSMGDTQHGVGYSDNGSTVELKYAIYGDTNLDGTVNFTDLLTLASNYGLTKGKWSTGDFNYDGTVNFSDLLTLASDYGQSLSPGEDSQVSASFAADWNLAVSEVSEVPEPSMVGVVGTVALGVLGRRRRFKSLRVQGVAT